MENEFLLLPRLFERTLDLVCVVDEPGWFIHVNPAVCKTLGYTKEELLSKPVYMFIHPDDREKTKAKRHELLNQVPLTNFQNRYIAKDGQIVWLEWTSVYIPEQQLVFAIAKNITAKKTAEIEAGEKLVEYKELAVHFKHNMEKERQLFASELHEELAQMAASIKLDFDCVRSFSSAENDTAIKRIDHGIKTTQSLINKIRNLYDSINPACLDLIGLNASLHSLCNEFQSTTGIPCTYVNLFSEETLSREVKLDLFRICQEALANVIRHAGASNVLVRVQQTKTHIELLIEDDGRGFAAETKENFGLRDMRGRAASIDGELLIETNQKTGTKVSIIVDRRKW